MNHSRCGLRGCAGMARLLRALLALLVLSLAWPAPSFADPPKRARSEARKKQRPKRERKPRAAPPNRERSEVAEAKPAEGKAPETNLTAAQKAAQEAAQGANAEIVKEGDTSVKVMKFTGIDIEGRLKSPQLLYFVSRVHAEFDRPKLPHRSFMPELGRSTQQEPVR
jgi:hypothetical protein